MKYITEFLPLEDGGVAYRITTEKGDDLIAGFANAITLQIVEAISSELWQDLCRKFIQ